MRRAVTLVFASLAILLVVSTAANAITVKAAAKQYLKDVAPVNSALTKFADQAGKWSDSTTDAQAENDATPAINALQKLQNELLSQSWPAKAKGDVRTLYKAIPGLEANLFALSGITILNDGSWLSTFSTDSATIGSDSNIVRHDLKLPLNS